MLLNGNQRGGAKDLAMHLLKAENEHVEVHELRGFISDDLVSALNEAYAISKGTRARQFLYSLSLNPPLQENVSTEDFESAIDQVEQKLGLSGQPRAIVFHEKKGPGGYRRHAHAVWSRIDTSRMKAINLPYSKLKLRDISKGLYMQHGWHMPKGLIDPAKRDPHNFTLAQWQQAKRNNKDPREIKRVFRECWAASDSRTGFESALKQNGYWLAKGERRGFIALNHRCEVFSIPKWAGIKTKEVRARLGNEDSLLSMTEVKAQIVNNMTGKLTKLKEQQDKAIAERTKRIDTQFRELAGEHKLARLQLKETQAQRWQEETKQRQERFSKGLRGILDRVTGKYRKIKQHNERDTQRAKQRDQRQRDQLIFKQADQRQIMQRRLERLETFRQIKGQDLSNDITQYQDIKQQKRDVFEQIQKNSRRQQNRGPGLEL